MAVALWLLIGLAVMSLLICCASYWGNRKADEDFGYRPAPAPDVAAFAGKAVAFIAGTALLMLGIHAWLSRAAHSHEGDDALAEWYRSLLIPGTQTGCCSTADCGPVPYRVIADGYEVEINGLWMKVPEAAIIHRLTNPTGDAIACYLPHRGIMCFVRPSEA